MRRRRPWRGNTGNVLLGVLLLLGGFFIILRLLPPWALWGVVALVAVVLGWCLLSRELFR